MAIPSDAGGTVGTGVAVPAAPNVDPNATGQVGEPSVNGLGSGATSTGGATAPVSNPPVVTPGAGTPGAVPSLADTNAQAQAILQDSTNQLAAAQADVAKIWDQIQQQQDVVAKLRADPASIADPSKLNNATTQLNSLYSTLSAMEQRVETANVAKATAAQKVLDSVQLTPEQKKVYAAQADSYTAAAEQAHQTAINLDPNSPMGASQRDKLAADTALANANARLNDALATKAPAETALLTAQANQINKLLPGLIDKQNADVSLTNAQTDLTSANSALVQANTGVAKANQALVNAQATLLTPAEAANQQSQAALNQAKIQQAQQGPVYGLQDQISAIKAIQQQVFGSAPPGADLDALQKQANDLLNQYVSAAIGGTTPYAASVAAQNAGQNIYTTQAALTNQASQAAASRANAFLGTGGNVLATLAGMNANAPAGSTAMAGAFQEVMNNLAQQSGQGQFAAPAQPQAPQLPSFLQRFAAPSPGASATGGNTTAPVTINIGGQSGTGASAAPAAAPSGQTTPVAATTPVATPNPNFAMASINDPSRGMAATGAQSPTAMPAYLQGQAAPTMDFLSNLWGKELSSGAVSM